MIALATLSSAELQRITTLHDALKADPLQKVALSENPTGALALLDSVKGRSRVPRAAVVDRRSFNVDDGRDFRENPGALEITGVSGTAVSDSGSRASYAGGTGGLYRSAACPRYGPKAWAANELVIRG